MKVMETRVKHSKVSVVMHALWSECVWEKHNHGACRDRSNISFEYLGRWHSTSSSKSYQTNPVLFFSIWTTKLHQLYLRQHSQPCLHHPFTSKLLHILHQEMYCQISKRDIFQVFVTDVASGIVLHIAISTWNSQNIEELYSHSQHTSPTALIFGSFSLEVTMVSKEEMQVDGVEKDIIQFSAYGPATVCEFRKVLYAHFTTCRYL